MRQSLRQLGIKLSRQTVKNILVENGIDPGPERGKGTWDEFLRSHAATLWQCDFATKRMWTIRGFVDVYFLVFLHLGTRRLWITPCTANPDSAWVAQQARNFQMAADDLAGLNAATGRFAVVEGVVHHIGETASRTYLDFGRRYTKDFTIVVPRAARRSFAAAGIDLKSLRGQKVRVRGVLFSSGGPAIEIRKPASLELLKDRGT